MIFNRRDCLSAIISSVFLAAVTVIFPPYLHAAEITIGTGTSTWGYPLATSYHDARTQTIYLASEIGTAGNINALSLYVTTTPGQVMNNFTIRMKHTDLSSYGSPGWDFVGWTVVYQTNKNITATGWAQFIFTTPFAYNDTQNLMVDISFNNSSYTTDGFCRYSTPGGMRTLYYRTNSNFGDPLNWSGRTPVPNMTTNVTNIKLFLNSFPPIVEAGENQVTEVNYVQLNGSVQDDGLPNPPGKVTTIWSQVNGPGTVIFEPNEYVLNPVARFSTLGEYILKLTADDGESQVDDAVIINYKQNEAPIVNAGNDEVIISPIDGNSAELNGQVSDDGLPKNPGYVTINWSIVSGPGTVIFEPDEYVLNPTARFSTFGEYVLKLTANDGELEGSDTVIINFVPMTKATQPSPANGAMTGSVEPPVLSWLVGDNPAIASHNVYISKNISNVINRNPNYMANVTEPNYTPGSIDPCVPYYWAVDAVDAGGNAIAGGGGDLWQFKTDGIEVERDGVTVGWAPAERVSLVTPLVGNKPIGHVATTRNGDIYILLSEVADPRLYHSSDGGRSWSWISLIGRLVPAEAIWKHTNFNILEDDTFIAIRVPIDSYDVNTDIRSSAAVYHSTDYGITWTEVSRIYPAPQENIIEGDQSIVQIHDGTILFPVRIWSWDYDNPSNIWADRFSVYAVIEGRCKNLLLCSNDGGITWNQSETFDFVCEPQVIQLYSGKMLGAYRYQRSVIPEGVPGYEADTIESVAALGGDFTLSYIDLYYPILKNVFIGESFDKGLTWENLHPVRDNMGNALLIFGEAHGRLCQVYDGRVVLLHEVRYPREDSQSRGRISYDEGNTWERDIYHLNYGLGYPFGIAMDDGTILSFIGTKPWSGTNANFSAEVVRWRPLDKKAGIPTAELKMFRKYFIVNRSVLFDASGSNDSDGSIVEYEWDFEGDYGFDYSEIDGSSPDGCFDGKSKYAYCNLGSYTVRSRVWDNNNNAHMAVIYDVNISNDSDFDDMPDAWENIYGLNVGIDDSLGDGDGDGFSNLSEYLHQSDPGINDSYLLPTTILVPSDVGTYQQAVGLAIDGDEIIMSSDLSNDGSVDLVDFAIFVQSWMDTSCGYCNGADFTGDGDVDWEDLGWLAEDWLAGKN